MHVVSIDEVPMRFGSTSFQSNEVKGAQKSEFLFFKNQKSLYNEFSSDMPGFVLNSYIVKEYFEACLGVTGTSPQTQVVAASG